MLTVVIGVIKRMNRTGEFPIVNSVENAPLAFSVQLLRALGLILEGIWAVEQFKLFSVLFPTCKLNHAYIIIEGQGGFNPWAKFMY